MVNGVLMTVSFFVLRIVGMGYIGVRVLLLNRDAFFQLPAYTTAMLTPIFVVGYAIQCAPLPLSSAAPPQSVRRVPMLRGAPDQAGPAL